MWDEFPRPALPEYFATGGEYRRHASTLVRAGIIEDATKIWWDIRLHPFFDTLEFRICDAQMRIEETLALAALCQAVTAKLYKLIKKNLGFRLYRRLLLNENKRRAARYGISGKLIDFGKQAELPARELIREMIEWFLDDVLDELGSRQEVEYAFHILDEGSSADRQLKTFEQTGDLKAVVDQIVAETVEGAKGAGSPRRDAGREIRARARP